MDELVTKIKEVDVFPLVRHYINELQLYNFFKEHIPMDPRGKQEPAEALCAMIANIIIAQNPLYRVEEWIKDYVDGRGEAEENALTYTQSVSFLGFR